MAIAQAPYRHFNVTTITCSVCHDANTVARSAKSETLSRWHVVSYPTDCQCPKCSNVNKPIEAPPEPPKRKPIPRSQSAALQYYRAALKLGQFSIQDIRAEGLPNPNRAASYLAGLVIYGKLIRTGKAQYAVKPKNK